MFQQRSSLTELIDESGIPFSDWEVCLKELNTVNTFLGGHAITIEGMKSILMQSNATNEITICEIGCGGGDNLKAINNWNAKQKNDLKISFIGVDINKACTDFAAKNCTGVNARFICSDYRTADFGMQKPDIIFNSLFCHHFTDDQLTEMLVWMKHNSKLGFFINDLQRHPVAYHSIKILTRIFSKSYLVKNDGPISVLRGFHKDEWQSLMRRAGIAHYSIAWKWAFRYLVTVSHEQ
jgi:2-polyprenyl-3-methyl-5-hydroxy-6-metoxy-1,4-benzoquinol methylase